MRTVSQWTGMHYDRRVGRGDCNSSSDHDYRYMDYRGYGQEEEEPGTGYDFRAASGHRDQADQLACVREFATPGLLHDNRPGFRQRRGGRGEGGGPGRVGKGLLSSCPPRSLVQPEVALPRLQREESEGEQYRRDFQSFRPGSEAGGRGGYPDNHTSHPGEREREGDWGRMEGGGQEDYNTVIRGPGEEKRFPRGGGLGKRKGFSMGCPGEDRGGPDPSSSSSSCIEHPVQMDYRPDLLDFNQRPSNIIMLRMLPPNATANEIRAQLQDQGIDTTEVMIRLMTNKSSDGSVCPRPEGVYALQ